MMKTTQEKTLRKFGIEPEAEACANCKHFYLHYIVQNWDGVEYLEPIFSGHCTYPRMKYRYLSDNCMHFMPKKTRTAK